MPKTATIVTAVVLGLVFGSFATVVAWRVPRKESIVKPGSHCPVCNAAILPYDNIPVFSFLILRGKCRSCHAKFGLRYPLVELAVAALFGLVAWRMPSGWLVPAYCAAALGFVILTDIDIAHKRLPVAVVYPTLVAGAALLVLAGAGLHDWRGVVDAAIFGAGGFAVFGSIWLAIPKGIGFGDVRLAGLCGMFLGFFGWRYVLVGGVAICLTGGVVGVALLAAGKASGKTQIPYGPFLAAGTMLGVLVGGPVAHAWLVT